MQRSSCRHAAVLPLQQEECACQSLHQSVCVSVCECASCPCEFGCRTTGYSMSPANAVSVMSCALLEQGGGNSDQQPKLMLQSTHFYSKCDTVCSVWGYRCRYMFKVMFHFTFRKLFVLLWMMLMFLLMYICLMMHKLLSSVPLWICLPFNVLYLLKC